VSTVVLVAFQKVRLTAVQAENADVHQDGSLQTTGAVLRGGIDGADEECSAGVA
jgi:hypothetical protein